MNWLNFFLPKLHCHDWSLRVDDEDDCVCVVSLADREELLVDIGSTTKSGSCVLDQNNKWI